ncbi:MAG: alpha/beta hydrolase [Ahrensia sp.]|nr:alpha/beta hydrolase [Ahrensia sp.]
MSVSKTENAETVRTFTHGDVSIDRESLLTSAQDGSRIASLRYRLSSRPVSALPALVCLSNELGCAEDMHRFALALYEHPPYPSALHAISLRGRGASQDAKISGTSVTNDADDLVAYCDARNLHHADFLVTGRSIYVLLLALIKRPGMARRVILNDAAPEFDAVAIARETALNHRETPPSNWDDAIALLKKRKGEQFPAFGEKDWEHAASVRWTDKDGKPAPTIDKRLVRLSNASDFDAPQPRLWREFKLLNTMPTLLIRGEHSALLTPELAERMQASHPNLSIEIAQGQGHTPALHLANLPQIIHRFLAE